MTVDLRWPPPGYFSTRRKKEGVVCNCKEENEWLPPKGKYELLGQERSRERNETSQETMQEEKVSGGGPLIASSSEKHQYE